MNYSLNEDKTEAATPHKIKKFQEKGDVQHLFDLNSFFILFFFCCIFYINKKFIFLHLLKLFILNLTFEKKIISQPQLFFLQILQHIKIFIFYFLILFLGILFILMFSPIFIQGNIAQIRFLKISFNSLNVVNNFKKRNLFDIVINFTSNLIKIIMIIIITLIFMWNHYYYIDNFYKNSLSKNIFIGFSWIYKYILLILLIVGIIAIIDSIIKYFQYFNKLNMTVQEIKNEQKEIEGNVLIKQRIQFLMRRQSLHRFSVTDLIKSNVIIFNAKNCAIAIYYDPITKSSPKILFKGLEKLSSYIVEIARKYDIPIFISNSLAIYLYNHSTSDNQIPSILYPSISKILAWAWQLKRWKQYGGIYPTMPIIFFNKQ
ncbi:Flagellar biosynthetic protein FlhB [Buchnera aphidicola (Cinara cuneomaculata)]|uniref:Flagellar biosynthetic protein FlhB n=1 Tax=Buchnera aphidicola (Cinara cuneomaculata) TaxID=1660040 RepID=A0A451CXP0_9GAMM|nr:EscU/YscU/HrcU family type III secretion system export apparatus switch protein [Buchnera aphidicola]VFP78149.1 Flagellar biosynthetic protein FlhB [Buchnera aphidicola (Cinara cuneomaculata)]